MPGKAGKAGRGTGRVQKNTPYSPARLVIFNQALTTHGPNPPEAVRRQLVIDTGLRARTVWNWFCKIREAAKPVEDRRPAKAKRAREERAKAKAKAKAKREREGEDEEDFVDLSDDEIEENAAYYSEDGDYEDESIADDDSSSEIGNHEAVTKPSEGMPKEYLLPLTSAFAQIRRTYAHALVVDISKREKGTSEQLAPTDHLTMTFAIEKELRKDEDLDNVSEVDHREVVANMRKQEKYLPALTSSFDQIRRAYASAVSANRFKRDKANNEQLTSDDHLKSTFNIEKGLRKDEDLYAAHYTDICKSIEISIAEEDLYDA